MSGSNGFRFDPTVHLKNYPTFDDIEERLDSFIEEIAEQIKEDIL